MKNIFSIAVIVILVGILVITNFTDLTKKDNETNLVDVTGDTSVDGVMITSPNNSSVQEGDTAPSFMLENLAGDKIKALDGDQEYILVNFWATWCAPCVEEMPDLQEFEQNNSETIEVVAVNVTNTETSVNKVNNFVEEGAFDFTILLDKDDTVYDAYSILAMPSSFFIRTSDLTIVKRVNGAMDTEQMEEFLKEIQEI